MSNLGESVSGWIVPWLQETSGMGVALGFGAFLCLVSTFAAIKFVEVDKERIKKDN